MRIVFVNFIKFWGGGESWTYQVMEELQKRGHSIILFSNTDSKLQNKVQQLGVKTFPFEVKKSSFLNPVLTRKLKKTLDQVSPDVVFLNSSLELKTTGLALKMNGCHKVIFMRGIPYPMKSDPLKKYLYSNVVTDIVVNSTYVKNSITNISGYLKKEPHIIYHGIQTDSSIFSSGNTKNIAIVGRLSHEKGVDIAIRMFQKVLIEHNDAKLWIIGDGKEKKKLIELTNELGIGNSVNFFGHINKVEELLILCSVLVMTSRWEGFGLVLLEAMKLKIPCVAFDHIAANEIIENNKSGYLIPDSNTGLMAEKISYLLSNPQIASEMGENGNIILKHKFTINTIIDQYENLMLHSTK